MTVSTRYSLTQVPESASGDGSDSVMSDSRTEYSLVLRLVVRLVVVVYLTLLLTHSK